jgi:4,5-DOPA dioxygenase extradiol
MDKIVSSINKLPVSDLKMPVLFIGHGSPMNAIEKNEYSEAWSELGRTIPRPAAVLCISAHWETKGTFVTAMDKPKTIHDFGGFPRALYEVEYPAPGSPAIAAELRNSIKGTEVGLDQVWGLDHGAWSVIKHMYPGSDVPVLEMSMDYYKSPQYHYELAKELSPFRNKGILIIGSGNMVHNLGRIAWDHASDPEYGYDWAIEAGDIFKKNILSGDYASLINYQKLGKVVQLAVPTPDHFLPLLYSLALRNENEQVSLFSDKAIMGSLTMTSVKIG